jgi:iron complex outermembrane recepter protein
MKTTKLLLIVLLTGLCIPLLSQQFSDTLILDEVVVTATKSDRNFRDIPARVSVIPADIIESSTAMQIDDIIRYTPGVNVNRSTGIYSQRPMVTLRGLSGDEQARTLVLMNGVPINTSDEGGVNWNRINHYDIERIEILKGSGSSLYGNNAMGGVINLITKTPQKPQEIYSAVSYGTFNTIRQDLNVRLRSENNFYASISQYYLQSDGYINVPEENRGPYDIERFLEAVGVSARVGYDDHKWFNWELQYDIYRDKRGEGEKIYNPDGNYRNFNTNLVRANLKGGENKTSYNFNVYYQIENYNDINERMRGTNYSRFDVQSFREDMGAFLNVNRELFDNNNLTLGAEYKIGSIRGGDYYQTAPFDTIYNAGKLNTIAGYIQDEHAFFDNKIRLNAGLRFDQVSFSDGEFTSTNPWNEEPEMKNHTWSEISPRAGFRFNFVSYLSAYVSYSHGFRASILDDLTRTGWMWVGPKYANPELQPESLDTYEIGFDVFPIRDLKISSSAYMMYGDDFLYYVATSDSIFGRPIFRRENVTNVEIMGLEFEFLYNITKNLTLMGGYTYADSRISQFAEMPELENKYLKYVPKHNASVSVFLKSRFVDASARAIYKGVQFGDDLNQNILDEYLTFDIMLSKSLKDRYIISLDVQNVLNHKHMETMNYLSPGRLITGKIAIKI